MKALTRIASISLCILLLALSTPLSITASSSNAIQSIVMYNDFIDPVDGVVGLTSDLTPRHGSNNKFIEEIGTYNPLTDPSESKIDEERVQYWLERGAQPTDIVKRLLQQQRSA